MATRMYVCESTEHPSLILSGLNEQRLKGVLCDVTVRVQGHLFKAHVNVLASAMGYFRDLFSKSAKEKHEGLIEIPVIVNSTGFAKILDFVYTSQLCLSQSTVMQVLCSACYLQIPYVVEKCQEFIGSHGHVTSPSSLSEVTGPLLQDLQRRNFSKPQAPNPISSASASLSLLSQLNRLSEKSRARLTQQTKSNLKNSPQRGQDTDEQQECELINTPPSPCDRSLTNGEDHRTTPDTIDHYLNGRDSSLKVSTVLSLKRERDGDASSNEDKQAVAVYSPQDRFTSCPGIEDRAIVKRHITSNQANDSTREAKLERDAIDHKLLAEYFSTDRERYTLQLDQSHNQNGFVTSSTTDQHLYSFNKNLTRDRPSDNHSNSSTLSFSIHQKKDKPKKEYRCEYCGKMFGRQQHLKRHILTHTGERPYPCQFCEKRFRRSEHLKHHLVSHEQTHGIEHQPNKKRQRKMQRVDDAYSLSKLMLDQYGSTDAERANAIENGAIPATPVILPSMFIDGPTQTSPSARVIELDDNVDNDSSEITAAEKNGHGASPSNNEQSMGALNLCRVSSKGEGEEDKSAHGLSNGHDNLGNISDDMKPTDGNQNSPLSSSSSPPMNAINGGYIENSVSSDIIGMEGSEVLTSDLKRLIAAMDE